MHEKSAIHCEENVKQHRASAAVLEPHLTKIDAQSIARRIYVSYLQDLSAAVKQAADDHKCLAQAMREIKLPKYEKWANYDEYLPMNIERLCDFFSLGI